MLGQRGVGRPAVGDDVGAGGMRSHTNEHEARGARALPPTSVSSTSNGHDRLGRAVDRAHAHPPRPRGCVTSTAASLSRCPATLVDHGGKPGRCEPSPSATSLVEHRVGGDAALVSTGRADQPATGGRPRRLRGLTPGACEPVRPAQLRQVARTPSRRSKPESPGMRPDSPARDQRAALGGVVLTHTPTSRGR